MSHDKNTVEKPSQAVAASPNDEPIVRKLRTFLESKPDLEKAVENAIRQAELFDIVNLAEYYRFLNDMVKLIPDDTNVNTYTNKYYYIADFVLEGIKDETLKQEFQNWSHQFAIEWGAFLDTPRSAKKLAKILTDPVYSIDDYFEGPSGWLTFNQFFARQIRPGKRPIHRAHDNLAIVSPADSFCKGVWPIEDNKVTVKGVTHSVIDLLDSENIDNYYTTDGYSKNFKEIFKNGLFTHSFLNTNDYHRFHIPVGGAHSRGDVHGVSVVKAVYGINGNVYLRAYKNKDGSIGSDRDELGWQFNQQRGLIVLDTGVEEIGHVAVLPIGMMQISSVVLTPRQGDTLAKGDEFGFFAFGGSDIITMFEKRFDYEKDSFQSRHYLQGEMIARIKK